MATFPAIRWGKWLPASGGDGEAQDRTFVVVVLAVIAITLFLLLLNLTFYTPLSIASLLAVQVVCLLALRANARGRRRDAGLLVSLGVVAAIALNILDGDGLFDPGIVALPIFITLGTMLLGSRSAVWLVGAAVVSLLVTAYLQATGAVLVTVRADDVSPLVPLLTLNLGAGLVAWMLVTNYERNVRRLEHSRLELQEAYDSTIEGWSKALEYRDRETEGHSQRVVALSVRLARALGCSDEEIRAVAHGALLHDIGKLGVPDKILLKEGPLDVEEQSVMHHHPTIGVAMLTGIRHLEPALAVIRHHHERWDGAGYPAGLRAEEIPLLARIFSVVDVWDALTHDRPYREAWQEDTALEHLRRNSGTMFDPVVVQAFLSMDRSC